MVKAASINHNLLNRYRQASAHLDPVKLVDDGYLLSNDGSRVVGRVFAGDFPLHEQFKRHLVWLRDHMDGGTQLSAESSDEELVAILDGLDELPKGQDMMGITVEEANAWRHRVEGLEQVEFVALNAQRTIARMRNLLVEIQLHQRQGTPLPSKLLVELGILLKETA